MHLCTHTHTSTDTSTHANNVRARRKSNNITAVVWHCHNRIEQQACNRHMVRCFKTNRSSKIIYTIVSSSSSRTHAQSSVNSWKCPHALLWSRLIRIRSSYLLVRAWSFVRSSSMLLLLLFILSILCYSFLLIFRLLLISCAKARMFDTINLSVCVLLMLSLPFRLLKTIYCNCIEKAKRK